MTSEATRMTPCADDPTEGDGASGGGQSAEVNPSRAMEAQPLAADAQEPLPEVLVFGGTAEGRMATEWLGRAGKSRVYASTVTEYGRELVDGIPHVELLTGAMTPDQMTRLMDAHSFACVVDATHPYATSVSEHVAQCASDHGLEVLRVLREGEPLGPWTVVADAQEAARLVAGMEGRVLLTTGSKDLPTYVAAMPDFRDRLFARVLPLQSSIEQTGELGFPASNVVAMQGPFSKDFNIALMRELDIDVMVTKASGKTGGFWEKVEAAQELGVRVVVIHRPVEEQGLSMDELRCELAARGLL